MSHPKKRGKYIKTFVDLFESEEAVMKLTVIGTVEILIITFLQIVKVKQDLCEFVTGSTISVTVTSTSSERSFSIASRTLEDRRTLLHPNCADALVFQHGLNKE